MRWQVRHGESEMNDELQRSGGEHASCMAKKGDVNIELTPNGREQARAAGDGMVLADIPGLLEGAHELRDSGALLAHAHVDGLERVGALGAADKAQTVDEPALHDGRQRFPARTADEVHHTFR